jgi:hypothetical protein
MMKFICFCYYDIHKFAALTPQQLAEVGPACHPHDAVLHDTGKVRVHASLSDPDTWKSIRPSQAGPQVSSGPFVNIGPQVGAFFILEADNMDEAVAAASAHAAANYGEHIGFGVEVRLCDSYDGA